MLATTSRLSRTGARPRPRCALPPPHQQPTCHSSALRVHGQIPGGLGSRLREQHGSTTYGVHQLTVCTLCNACPPPTAASSAPLKHPILQGGRHNTRRSDNNMLIKDQGGGDGVRKGKVVSEATTPWPRESNSYADLERERTGTATASKENFL